jgi:hypothetical protein
MRPSIDKPTSPRSMAFTGTEPIFVNHQNARCSKMNQTGRTVGPLVGHPGHKWPSQEIIEVDCVAHTRHDPVRSRQAADC